ncbi:hypothetical protein CGZ80_01795 [Rhodopirellula sp. MGV]|nr:hypothetical protein CGZ80_01795 [Rhodopirellula sp. MGV]PNY33525.1 hypothetical protein C2E31_28295 [Rhodopirellula baltica]
MIGELFDPQAPLAISEHYRPHWSQAGAIVFITFRTADSIPYEVLQRWEREKNEWIARNTGRNADWRKVLPELDPRLRHQFKKTFNRLREDFLDTCNGKCVLRQPDFASIVADSLSHFDGKRYRLGDFIVMPNHVHLLASFPSEETMIGQCDSWLHYTAWKINQQLGNKGKFWQQEPFDHLVRSPEQYQYLCNYIRDNGTKANLRSGDFLYRQHDNHQ